MSFTRADMTSWEEAFGNDGACTNFSSNMLLDNIRQLLHYLREVYKEIDRLEADERVIIGGPSPVTYNINLPVGDKEIDALAKKIGKRLIQNLQTGGMVRG